MAELFMDGMSTAHAISQTSGRGVGMGAIESAVQALGGELQIDSQPGRGTRLRLRFPESAVAPPARGPGPPPAS